jgi:hypothetical protein
MMLICTACGGTDEGISPEAVAIPMTPSFLESMRARQRLTKGLFGNVGAETLDSLFFHESSPQWLSWSEELKETLQVAQATGWAVADDRNLTITDSASATGRSHAVRTDCDFVRVWPERFQFTCCLRNADTALESAMLYFDDLFTAVTSETPAASGRPAA